MTPNPTPHHRPVIRNSQSVLPQVPSKNLEKNKANLNLATPKKKRTGNPTWKKGQSANPKGKPKGARNKFSMMQYKTELATGMELPLPFMLRVMRDVNNDIELRLSAARVSAMIMSVASGKEISQSLKEKKVGCLYQFLFPNGKSYIGITTNVASRFRDHYRTAGRLKTSPLSCAIRKHGFPGITILAIGEIEYLKALEVRAIAAFNSLYPTGYNLHEGGGVPPSQKGKRQGKEHRQRIAQALKRRAVEDPVGEHERRSRIATQWHARPDVKEIRRRMHNSPEWRRKVSVANIGKVRSTETRAHISASLIGRKISPECKAKISQTLRGRKASIETRAKMSLAALGNKSNTGRKVTEETKAKMRLAHAGRIVTAETRARISAGLRGHVMTQVTKDKIAASFRKRISCAHV